MSTSARVKEEKRQQAEWFDHVRDIEGIFLGIEGRLGNSVLNSENELINLDDSARLADGLVRSLLDDQLFRTNAAQPLIARVAKMQFKADSICSAIANRRETFYENTASRTPLQEDQNQRQIKSAEKAEAQPVKIKREDKKRGEKRDEWAESMEKREREKAREQAQATEGETSEQDQARDRAIASQTLNLPDYHGPPCKMCDQRHPLFRCPTFLAKVLWYRWEFVAEKRICRNCLRYTCRHNTCKDDYCYKCDEPHNRTLCPQRRENY